LLYGVGLLDRGLRICGIGKRRIRGRVLAHTRIFRENNLSLNGQYLNELGFGAFYKFSSISQLKLILTGLFGSALV
jgi:lipoate-protein ligase A